MQIAKMKAAGLTYEEMGEKLSRTPGSIRSYYHRVMKPDPKYTLDKFADTEVNSGRTS